jgi:hypothetical protein
MNRPIGMDDFWPSSGFHLLKRNERAWLVPTDAWLARFLTRPELALQDESCAAEQTLHQELHQAPRMPVSAEDAGRPECAQQLPAVHRFSQPRAAGRHAGSLLPGAVPRGHHRHAAAVP